MNKSTASVVCILVALGTVWVAFMAGCGRQRDHLAVVRLGYLQSDLHHLPAFVALEKGLFTQAGLRVEVAGVFRAGPEEMSAFAAGDLDIGYVGQAPATVAILNGVADAVFIAQVNLEGSSIVVQKNSPAQRLSDLRGATIAIPGHATMQDFLLRRALRAAGMPVGDVTLIVLKPPEMLQAVGLGNIDACIAWEPYPSQAVLNGSGRVLLESGQIWKGHPCCVLVADAKFAKARPDAVCAIRSAHERACAFIAGNRDEAVAIGMKYTGMDRPAVAAAIEKIFFTPVLNAANVSEFIDFLRDLRYIRPRSQKLRAQDLIVQ